MSRSRRRYDRRAGPCVLLGHCKSCLAKSQRVRDRRVLVGKVHAVEHHQRRIPQHFAFISSGEAANPGFVSVSRASDGRGWTQILPWESSR